MRTTCETYSPEAHDYPAPNYTIDHSPNKEIIMLESNFKAVTDDVNILLKDAQALFQNAATMTGDKADEMRKRAMSLVDTAATRTQELQNSVIAGGKDAVLSANAYVTENPWRVIAAGVGLGLVAGLILGSK